MKIELPLSHKNSSQYHVFELSRQLPRFTLYIQAPPNTPQPKSHVTFAVNERINRVVMWVNQNFLLDEEVRTVSLEHCSARAHVRAAGTL